MNYRYVTYHLGLLLLVLAAALGLTTALELLVFGWTKGGAAGGSGPGRGHAADGARGRGAVVCLGRNTTVETLHRRDALLLVAVGWLVGAGLAATPYYVWAQIGGADRAAEQRLAQGPHELAVGRSFHAAAAPTRLLLAHGVLLRGDVGADHHRRDGVECRFRTTSNRCPTAYCCGGR